MVPDRTWEHGSVLTPSVLYDPEEGLFRMWYTIWNDEAYRHQDNVGGWDPEEHGYPYSIAYAESVNGIDWTKPLKGIRYKGGPTNIVLTGTGEAAGHRVIFNHPSTGQPGRFLMCYRDRSET